MQIKELLRENIATADANLITALTLLRARANNQGANAVINTQSLINMVKNTDQMFSYDALVNANDNNEAVKNIIKSFNKDKVTLYSDSDEGEVTNTQNNNGQGSADTVGNMAKHAGKTRHPDLF